jgi:hypothetical protein
MDPEGLYRQMSRMRAFELALADLWRQGLISGERVATEVTIPFARNLEDEALPNVERILTAAGSLMRS